MHFPTPMFDHSVRCFYIDSPANARANGMQIKPNLKNEAAIAEEWAHLIPRNLLVGLLIQTYVQAREDGGSHRL